MIFIFGFGQPKRKTIGPLEEINCNNCNNQKFWILEKYQEWATVFFIPIIPTLTKYFKYCPICKNAIELSKEEFNIAEPIAQSNQTIVDNF